MLKYKYIFQINYTEALFSQQHSETVTVAYQWGVQGGQSPEGPPSAGVPEFQAN